MILKLITIKVYIFYYTQSQNKMYLSAFVMI